MNPATDDGTPFRRDPPSTRQVMTRHNGLVFYGLGAASFLETAVALHATRLLHSLAGEPEVQRWIEERWWPAKYAHGRAARFYIEATWPEFDWSAAYASFYDAYRPLAYPAPSSGSPAEEALACSVSAAQASAFYRCLGNACDDVGFRRTLHAMSADESAHFSSFRRLVTRLERGNRLGLLKTYRTIVACARRARDVDVQLAHSRLGPAHWYGSVPFPELEYRDFVQRMAEVVRRHVTLSPAQRVLFRPWWQARRLARSAPPPAARSAHARPLPGAPLQARPAL